MSIYTVVQRIGYDYVVVNDHNFLSIAEFEAFLIGFDSTLTIKRVIHQE